MNEQRQYRGWSIQENKWVYGWYFVDGAGKHFIVSESGDIHSMENNVCDAMFGMNARELASQAIENMPDFIEVDPNSVGQYIGANDCDDNPIYEGDMAKHSMYGGIVGIVTFTTDHCDFEIVPKEIENSVGMFWDHSEIVGNAWEDEDAK